jgi:phosphatidylglycerophosphate synthase
MFRFRLLLPVSILLYNGDSNVNDILCFFFKKIGSKYFICIVDTLLAYFVYTITTRDSLSLYLSSFLLEEDTNYTLNFVYKFCSMMLDIFIYICSTRLQYNLSLWVISALLFVFIFKPLQGRSVQFPCRNTVD